jgi:hypothetical protein
MCEATCGTLLQQKSKVKDHKNAREDLKELGIRPELYAEETEMGTNLPVAATTLSKEGRKEFCQLLHDLKVPLGYSSNFKRLVSEGHENEFQLDEISLLPCIDDNSSSCCT